MSQAKYLRETFAPLSNALDRYADADNGEDDWNALMRIVDTAKALVHEAHQQADRLETAELFALNQPLISPQRLAELIAEGAAILKGEVVVNLPEPETDDRHEFDPLPGDDVCVYRKSDGETCLKFEGEHRG